MAQNNQQNNKNIELYEKLRTVPDNAKKKIEDGRLKGKTDINPMWRFKRLTEVFGVCGIGWKYNVTKKWIEDGGPGCAAAFVDIDLFIKDPATGQWSEAIPGTGGNVFKRTERSGNVFLNDDCYKMALTDAISVATKALGLAADVYFESDSTKYSNPNGSNGEGAPTGYAAPAQQSGYAPAPQMQPYGGYMYPPQGVPGPAPVQPIPQPAHAAPNQDGAPVSTKMRLFPGCPQWNPTIAKAACLTDTPEQIRERLSRIYEFTEEDFKQLMRSAGKGA